MLNEPARAAFFCWAMELPRVNGVAGRPAAARLANEATVRRPYAHHSAKRAPGPRCRRSLAAARMRTCIGLSRREGLSEVRAHENTAFRTLPRPRSFAARARTGAAGR